MEKQEENKSVKIDSMECIRSSNSTDCRGLGEEDLFIMVESGEKYSSPKKGV